MLKPSNNVFQTHSSFSYHLSAAMFFPSGLENNVHTVLIKQDAALVVAGDNEYNFA